MYKVQSSTLLVQHSSFAAGFTLLEILASIAIIGIILTSLFTSFFTGKKTVDILDKTVVRLQEMRMVSDMLRREIESALYSKDKSYTVFRIEGRDIDGRDISSITFTTFSSLVPGPVKVSYCASENGPSLKLRKNSTKLMNKGSQDVEGIGVDILEDMESFVVEARYKDQWVRTWDTNLHPDIPEEIRFTIAVNINGSKYVIQDVARIRTGRAFR